MKLRQAETRLHLLTDTIEHIPTSLQVAMAEKRVLEGKLEKALLAHDNNVQRIQLHAVSQSSFHIFLCVS